jgi:hypothetical protein
MPAITYNDFSGGLDRRLPIGVQEASRLYVLRNAYVTLGKRIRKRPAVRNVLSDSGGSPLDGTVGLEAVNGSLVVFGTAVAPAPGLAGLPVPTNYVQLTGVSGSLLSVKYADIFQGFMYVVAGHSYAGTQFIRHHYVDGGTTVVADAPDDSPSVTKAASRIFAIDGETVKYSAAGDARDWTTANDAGFLPASLQQDTKSNCSAVGTYQDSLVVFFSESAQVWTVALDPSANAIRKRVDGVGCEAFQSLAGFANDLMFLSPYGFRSMTVQAQTDRIDDTDVGVAIDPLVVADIEAVARDVAEQEQVFGQWIPELGQYWAIFDTGDVDSSKAWVYTHSKSSKIACWSEYTFPINITGMATLAGKVYLRTSIDLYELDAAHFRDGNDIPIEVEVQMAFQDAKQPGVAKQFYGADFVVEGSPTVAYKYDPRDLDKESVAMTIPGDTRPGDVMPVEIVCSAIAPVFRHSADEAFELDAMSLYFNALGVNV